MRYNLYFCVRNLELFVLEIQKFVLEIRFKNYFLNVLYIMSEDKKDENIVSPPEGEEKTDKVDNQPSVDENLNNQTQETGDQNQETDQIKETSVESPKEEQNDTPEHQVIHKKDEITYI